MKKRKFKVGDIVTVLEATYSDRTPLLRDHLALQYVGNIGEITNIIDLHPWDYLVKINGHDIYVFEDQIMHFAGFNKLSKPIKDKVLDIIDI